VTDSIRGEDEQVMQQRLVASLLRGAALPAPPPGRIEHVETHISHVLLVGDRAYKIKKPLNLGFLDFTGLDRRRHYCEEEIRLNRRLAPELYLDCVPINGSPEAPRLGGDPQTAIEFAVCMRRFEQSALLDRVAATGGLTAQLIGALTESLASFHAAAPRAPESRFGEPTQVLAPMLDNFTHTRPLLRDPAALQNLEAVETWTRARAAALVEILDGRRRDGHVRECHGDVHLGNVALIDGRPVLFDCVEFNDDFRWIDTMSDLGFLLMDLDARGLPNLGWLALNVYLEHGGDYPGLAVLPLYRCYRAMVRAKVAAIRASQGELSALADCHRYLNLARQYTETAPPAVALTQGLSGSGKTTVSGLLCPALGAVRIRSDVERKRLFGYAPEQSAAAEPGAGIYRRETSERVYRHLAELADAALAAGFNVVIDAANLRRCQRALLAAAARQRGVPLVYLLCQAPEASLRDWLQQRARQGGDASDADEAVLAEQIASAEPLGPDEGPALTLATREPLDAAELARRVRQAWQAERLAGTAGHE